jgi:hypothetical protein
VWRLFVLRHAHHSFEIARVLVLMSTDTALGPKPATNVASFAATLNGLLDPHGLTTSVYFQYGTTTNYGRHGCAEAHWKHLPEYC